MFPFLEAIQIGFAKSRAYWGEIWSPDFLFPSWTDSIPFSSPCSYHHALALIRFYTQCNWIQPPLLSAEEAKHLSTHSMKSTMLAAAGQLNMNLEQRAKQGHHKKYVQLYSRDDVWPSLFLQRDILVDISTGWRPLTSQSRGAKLPLPEPPFHTPPITQADLQLIQMLPPTRDSKQSPTTSDIAQTHLQCFLTRIVMSHLPPHPLIPPQSINLRNSTPLCWRSMKKRMLSMEFKSQTLTPQKDLVSKSKVPTMKLCVGLRC